MFGLSSRPSGRRNTDNYKFNDVGRRKRRTCWGPWCGCSTRGRPRCLRHHVTLGPGERCGSLRPGLCFWAQRQLLWPLLSLCHEQRHLQDHFDHVTVLSSSIKEITFFFKPGKNLFDKVSCASENKTNRKGFFFGKPLAYALIAVSSSHYVLPLNSMKNPEVF